MRLSSRHSVVWLIMGEATSLVAGLASALYLARTLGPTAFGRLEFATALVGWWMILVRGGFDALVIREAAKAPEKLSSLYPLLILGRLSCALVGWLAVILCGWLAGQILVCSTIGCLLVLSALAPDLRSRVEGATRVLAAASAGRGLVSLAWVLCCVGEGNHPVIAVLGMVLGEATAWLVFRCYAPEKRSYGWLTSGNWMAIWERMQLSALPSAWRFSRVMVYALDPLLLGFWADPDLGDYSAARRICFALLGVCLTIPGTLTGPLAAAFASGSWVARKQLSRLTNSLLWITLPPTLGLWLTGPQWMPLLFGPTFSESGHWLRLLVIRVPILALSALFQTAIFAFGRERWVALLSLGILAAAFVAELFMLQFVGAWGVAWAVLLIELTGLVAGWTLLRRLHASPDLSSLSIELLAGLVGILLGCFLLSKSSVLARSAAGVAGFGAALLAAKLAHRIMMLRVGTTLNPTPKVVIGEAK